MKQCKRCLVTKELSSFNKSRTGSQGLHDYCKQCLGEYRKTHAVGSDSRFARAPAPKIPGNKVCVTCRKELPATSEFFSICRRTASGLRPKCKPCFAKYTASWKQAHKEAVKEHELRFKNANPGYWSSHPRRRPTEEELAAREARRMLAEERKKAKQLRHFAYVERVAKNKALREAAKEKKKLLAGAPSPAQLAWYDRQRAYWKKWKEEHIEERRAARRRQPARIRYRVKQSEKLRRARIKKYASRLNTSESEIERLLLPENTLEFHRLRRRHYHKACRKRLGPFDTLRTNLRHMLKRLHIRKSRRTTGYLGCTRDQLKEHLAAQFSEGMTMANYGTAWTVDHVRPLASFDHTVPGELEKAWHFTNLRPLSKRENSQKGSLWNGVRHRYRKPKAP